MRPPKGSEGRRHGLRAGGDDYVLGGDHLLARITLHHAGLAVAEMNRCR